MEQKYVASYTYLINFTLHIWKGKLIIYTGAA